MTRGSQLDGSTRAFARTVIWCVAYHVLALVLAHLLRPEVDAVALPVSAYVAGPYGILVRTTYFTLGLSLLLMGPAIRRTASEPAKTPLGPLLFAVAAAGVFVAGIFVADLPGGPASGSGDWHELGEAIAFPAMGLAMLITSAKLRLDDRWKDLAAMGIALAIAFLVTALLLVLFLLPAGYGGLGQRLVFLLLFTWMVMAARRVVFLGA